MIAVMIALATTRPDNKSNHGILYSAVPKQLGNHVERSPFSCLETGTDGVRIFPNNITTHQSCCFIPHGFSQSAENCFVCASKEIFLAWMRVPVPRLCSWPLFQVLKWLILAHDVKILSYSNARFKQLEKNALIVHSHWNVRKTTLIKCFSWNFINTSNLGVKLPKPSFSGLQFNKFSQTFLW